MLLPTILTVVLVLALVAVLVVGVTKIVFTLERIGGASMSYMGENMGDRLSGLAKIRWGLRAIERQTSAIEPEVTRLNDGLVALDEALGEVEAGLGGLVEALDAQGGSR